MAIQTSFTTPSSAPEAIYNLITALCLAGWTIPAWTDGTTYHDAAINPGVGPWPKTTNPYAGFGGAVGELGRNNAWFRITSPDGPGSREWMFQRATLDSTWTVARSRTGFSGTVAGTAPTDPTTGQTMLSAAVLFPAIALTHRWVISLENSSPYGWFAFLVQLGGGNIATVLFDEPMSTASIPVGDTDPVVSGLVAYNVFTPITPLGILWSSASSTVVKVWKRLRNGLANASNVRVSTLLYIDGAAIPFGTSTAAAAPAQAAGSSYQVSPDPVSQTEFPLPIVVTATGAPSWAVGYGGICNRLRWCTVAGRNNGQTLYDATNALYWIFAGGMWVPWDSSQPNI